MQKPLPLCGGFIFTMEKKCSKCKELRSIDLFRRDYRYENAYRASCKICEREADSKRRKGNLEKYAKKTRDYRKKNPDKIKKYDKDRYSRRIDKIREYDKTEERKDSKRKAVKKLKEKDPGYFARYNRNKRKTDKNYAIAQNHRNRIAKALKGITKGHTSAQLLGCTIPELKTYLEAKFLPTMTWENYGTLWHIDHITPCASFDLTDPEQQKTCFHYTNLQPLFAVTTIIDGVVYMGNLEKSDSLIT